MAKAKMNDAVEALKTIKAWTTAVHDDLSEYAKTLTPPDPTLTAAIAEVNQAVQAADRAVRAAAQVPGNLNLLTDVQGKLGAVPKLSSGVAKNC